MDKFECEKKCEGEDPKDAEIAKYKCLYEAKEAESNVGNVESIA